MRPAQEGEPGKVRNCGHERSQTLQSLFAICAHRGLGWSTLHRVAIVIFSPLERNLADLPRLGAQTVSFSTVCSVNSPSISSLGAQLSDVPPSDSATMGAQSFTCSVPMSVRLTCPNNFTTRAHRPSDLPESNKAAPRIVPAWPRAPRSQFSSLGAHGRFSNVCRACLSESCSSGRAPPWPLALLQGARLLSQARLPERGAYALCEHGNVV